MGKEKTKTKSKTKEKRMQSVRKSINRIDGMERSMWFGITIAYVIFVAILSGMTKVYLPEMLFLGAIPIDPQYGVWALGLALWIPISLLMQAYFKQR